MSASENEVFYRHLQLLMFEKGWSPSDLARETGLQEEEVSSYVLGTSLPSSAALNILADALTVAPYELYQAQMPATEEDRPTSEIRSSLNKPNKVLLRIDRIVSMETAAKITRLLADDQAQIS
jgi:transcriptional regulator with XRE-family HTH domain